MAKHAEPFLRDIEPFLYGRPITYVDVGAHMGDTLKQLAASRISIREAHVVEPNPASFEKLKLEVAALTNVKQVIPHNVALSARAGLVDMQDAEDMTRIIGLTERAEPHADGRIFRAKALTLDELAADHSVRDINLLKIDVEGHELAVIEGAHRLLSKSKIDILYLEAGFDQASSHQAYYRSIEDALAPYGYRVFGIYEQVNEWPTDSPLLRRINLAFFSPKFAEDHRYKVTRELFGAKMRNEQLDNEAKTAKASLARHVSEALERAKAHVGESERILALEDKLRDAERTWFREAAMLTAWLDRTEAERNALADKNDRLRDQNASLKQEAARARSRHNAVVASNSWRLTKPLRWVGRFVKRAVARRPGRDV